MGGIIYRARPRVCPACPIKKACCGTDQARTVFRPGDWKERRGLRRAQFRGRDRMRVQAFLTATAYTIRKLALRKRPKPASGVNAQ
jgi:hypothetical protein